MALRIDTFSNQTGGNALFKALGHPEGADRMAALIRVALRRGRWRSTTRWGPRRWVRPTCTTCRRSRSAGVYVQDLADLGQQRLGHATQPVTDLRASAAKAVFVAAFDAGRFVHHVRHLLPAGAAVATLDDAKLPDELLTNKQRYLDPLNFATNFVFFR